MLDDVLAQKLANRIIKQLGYNINIMNEKGIIIASGDSQRIGDFHEIAYKIVTRKLDIVIVNQNDEHFIGVKPGINMPIVYNKEIIGVIGISGNPDVIREFALIVRLSFETMVEYELYKQQIQKRKNTKNILLNTILYEEPINTAKVKSLARELKYDETAFRVPVIIKLLRKDNIASVLSLIKNSTFHSAQDISVDVSESHIVVFKYLSQTDVNDYKNQIKKYADDISEAMLTNSRSALIYYTGLPQNRFEDYRQAYQLVSWLEKHTSEKNSDIFFFSSYTFEYIQSSVSFEIYETIFSCYIPILDALGNKFFNMTVEALLDNNMNINKTSKQLYMHRNTVMFRLNKIKDAFCIDPVNNMSDREFLANLLYYNKNRPEKD